MNLYHLVPNEFVFFSLSISLPRSFARSLPLFSNYFVFLFSFSFFISFFHL